MKANEIISRQNRVVYVLLVVTAALGLTWAIWQHNHAAAATPATPVAAPPAVGAPGPR